MRTHLIVFAAVVATAPLACAQKKKSPVWTDAAAAQAEHSGFALQGEYTGKGEGLQLVALADGKFYSSVFTGGLPGAGWDGSAPAVDTVDEAGAKAAIAGREKVDRESPTLGAEPPAGAVVLFGGEASDLMKGKVEDGLLWAGAQTAGEYGDFQLHLEFRLPYKPDTPPSSQDRGNSGVYLHNRYEVQILDSFGLVYDRDQVKLPIKSDPRQWCGCFYKFKAADVPMCLPPLRWQTYDIDFKAARFNGEEKTANAVITVRHNGVVIHDAVELPKGTGAGGGRKEVPKGPIIFQGHGNPVAFRNVWLVEK